MAADTHRYTLYGGARGPGKSFWLRWWLLRYVVEAFRVLGLRGVRVMLACEDYPALQDRHLSKIQVEYPSVLGAFNQQAHEYRLAEPFGGGVICFRNLDNPAKYQSAEFAAIGVDELTKNQRDTFDILRGSLRWPGVRETRFVAATNPGGPGHLWVKQLWVDRQFPAELAPLADEFVFVRALPADNPHLSDTYWQELSSLPDPLRRAWVDGDWNVFAGQVFGEWRPDLHVVKPFAIPAHWPRWRAIDWGYAAPFCCLWLTNDPDTRRHYVYRELYETKLTDRDQAQRIKAMTAPGETVRMTLADPSMWTQKSHEGLTFSTADEYNAEGVWLQPADNNRLNGLRRVRELLMVRDGQPGLCVFETCTNLIRTLPALPYDPVHIEDVDTHAEDHCLVAGTMITVRGGDKPIEQLTPGDVVLTRGGWRVVQAAGLTLRMARIYRVRTADGREICGTDNHPVFTEQRGFVPLCALRYGDILSTNHNAGEGGRQWAALSSSTAGGIGSLIATIAQVGYTCIGRFGAVFTETSRQDITFTTSTETRQTTALKTLSWWQRMRICLTTGISRTRGLVTVPTLPLGISRRQVTNGTGSMPLKFGARAHARRFARCVTTAALSLRQLICALANTPFALTSASQHTAGVATLTMLSGPVSCVTQRSWQTGTPTLPHVRASAAVVIGVTDAGRADVYNLTVDGESEYYANGILVHNCYDALRYGLMRGAQAGEGKPVVQDDPFEFAG